MGLFRRDPEKQITTHVSTLTSGLDSLVSARLSESEFSREVDKLTAPLVGGDVEILRQVLTRAEAIYDERMESGLGRPFAILACRDAVKELRKRWL